MFSLAYNFCLILFALFSLPKIFRGKYKNSWKERLGISLPEFSPKKGQKVIWIHSISMGETRAIIPLFRQIRETYPDAAVVISTTTETGQAEAKRSMPDAHAHFYLPLDFSWTIRRLLDQIKPTTLILCESDFWYHLLTLAKKRGVHIALVNGKVSERSCGRFQKLPFFTRRLFAPFHCLCVQSERHLNRFLSLGIPKKKLFITGNLKFDAPVKKLPDAKRDHDPVLVIGSTHAPEEELLLTALDTVWKKIPQLKVFLVPRHPERFDAVASLIQSRNIPFRRYSENKSGDERLILIDAMGLLNQCYQSADLAIVGGSYTPHVGGHNIFEPVLLGVPVLFGPHMHSQSDIEELVLSAEAGKKVEINDIPSTLIDFLTNSALHKTYADACISLSESVQGSTQRTFEKIFQQNKH